MKKLLLAFAITFLHYSSCQKQSFTPSVQSDLGTMSFGMSMVNAPEDVVDIKGFLSRISHDTIFFDFNVTNDSATTTVNDIYPGHWKLTVNAYDIDTVIIYSGSTNVIVSPGVVSQVYLQLNPNTGSLEIIVTWGSTNPQVSSMIAYYPFNGNANDESGNGNNGLVYGAQLTNDRNGNANSAYYFDGIDDYIEIENNTFLKPQLPIAIGMWIKYNSVFSQIGNIFTSDFHPTNYFGVFVGLVSDPNRLTVSFGDGGGIGPSSRRSKYIAKPTPDVWFHFVGVIRGANDIDIYINGVNAGGTYDGYGDALAYDGGHMNIGRVDSDQHGPPRYLKGKLDEIIMFNRALTEQEILTLYQNN